jgi:predicted TIM-barrel fold metal-dependent hydrolase
MSNYKLVSSDSHVFEPPDLWEKRIDPKFKGRVRLVREGNNDQWYADSDKFGMVGVNQQAGLRFETPEKISFEGTYDTVGQGGLDPHAHVKDMDLDGVAGGLLYPSIGLTAYMVPSSDLLSAILQAYNDYVADFCKPYPNRLKGIAMLNVDNVEEAVRELERVAKMGLAGAMIPVRPILRYDHPDYEPLWAVAQDLDMPLSLHVGTVRWRPDLQALADMMDPVFFSSLEVDARTSLAAMIFSGVFESYPKLKVAAVEFEVVWAAYFMERMDNTYKERAPGVRGRRFKGDVLPSDFFRSNVYISFQEDANGMQLRHYIGVDNLMWGSDYPHAESTFPRSREIVDQFLQSVPEEEKAKIAGANAARLYHIDL